MNDHGLGDVIENTADQAHNARRPRSESKNGRARLRAHSSSKPTHTERENENEGDDSIYQATQWWFFSTAFPLIAGTFGPVANLFSVCALVQTWRVGVYDGERVADEPWLIALNATSLAFALFANIVLLLNFARRIRYTTAQPITITFWYIASLLLLIPLCLTHSSSLGLLTLTTHSQSYYYALISCTLYSLIATLLLLNTLGSTLIHEYPPSFSTLTPPQRTLMLQTIAFTTYLSLGAGLFSHIEGWGFADGVYWADYTLLTIGLGTDFPLTSTLARCLLVPYAAFGIMLVGLVVGSVRGLVLERARAKVVRRRLGKERERWRESVVQRRRVLGGQAQAQEEEVSTQTQTQTQDSPPQTPQSWLSKRKSKHIHSLPTRLAHAIPLEHEHAHAHNNDGAPAQWHRAEFELMRHLQKNAETTERYVALGISFIVILFVWIGGALVFWVCERTSPQKWTLPTSLYFTYTTLLTIGYGDFYPSSAPGKPFFVVWSLLSVPAMTVFVGNLGEGVVRLVGGAGGGEGEGEGGKREGRRGRCSAPRDVDDVEQYQREHAGFEDLTITTTTTSQPDIEQLSTHIEELESDIEDLEQDEIQARRRAGSAGLASKPPISTRKPTKRLTPKPSQKPKLAHKIAREITLLARDLRVNGRAGGSGRGMGRGRRYEWEEWVGWLEMLGERGGGGGVGGENGHGGEKTETEKEPEMETEKEKETRIIDSASLVSKHSKQRLVGDMGGDARPFPPLSLSPSPSPNTSDTSPTTTNTTTTSPTTTTTNTNDRNRNQNQNWNWTWLSDHGPLFSEGTETEWILERLCVRLEEVMRVEDEDEMGVRVRGRVRVREEEEAGEEEAEEEEEEEKEKEKDL